MAKHASVDRAALTVRRAACSLQVTVADHGEGFDPAAALERSKDSAFGLFSIRERLGHLGGDMNVESSPGGGTTILLKVPLSPLSSGDGNDGTRSS